MKRIHFYRTEYGRCPFIEWHSGLKDTCAQAKVMAYITRIAHGLSSSKNVRGIEGRIKEIKIDFGPGYRVYYADQSASIILLLVGGTKRGQNRDIEKAKEYWRDYESKN